MGINVNLEYSLTGKNATLAVERGLAEADWYQCRVQRRDMRLLLERSDGPAIRDTLLWFALISGAGYLGYELWGSWWAIIPFAVYGVLYASSSDSRWHESGHGTAFKTDWLNDALYEIAFNVRIAMPPPGRDCAPGIGSAYIFSLKSGDLVTAIGPFGDFHPKPTQREAVYIGGGSGMAPLRAHLSDLLETRRSHRRLSFWYGARARQEIFYDEYFTALACTHPNFSFHLALSSPLPEDAWTGATGLIHEVVLAQYLKGHGNPRAIEYYLCGPPLMIKACTQMLTGLGVGASEVAYDEF